MKILFFTHYFPPEVNAPASRTFEMCKRWVRAGHEVTVITCAPNAPDGVLYPGYRNRISQAETIEGIHVIRVWTLIAANRGTVRRMLNYLSYMFCALFRSLFVDRPDVVIATSPQLFCGWAGALCAMVRRRAFIIEMRDMFTESITTLTSVKGGVMLKTIHRFELMLYRRGKKLVTVGPGYQRGLIEQGIPAEHIEIITNGVDREVFDPETSGTELRSQWQLDDQFIVTYAGTIGMAHGLEVVLDAAEQLERDESNRITFLLVGEGAQREALQQQATIRGLSSVKFLGKLPKSMMPAVLAASDCCLVHLLKAPLYTSVLPSKIFEMAYMKRPIVLGVEGDAADVVQASGGGICIEPGNATELIAAVLRLERDPELREELGQSGHDYVSEHYDRDKLAAKFLLLVEDIYSGKSSEGVSSFPVQKQIS